MHVIIQYQHLQHLKLSACTLQIS